MYSFIVHSVAFFILAPFFLLIVIFYIAKLKTKNTQKAIQLAADWSTVFFILSVYFLIRTLFHPAIFFLLIVILLLLLLAAFYVYLKMNRKIHLKKLLNRFWRMNFLLFFILYIILFCIGLISSSFKFLQ